MHDNKLKYQTYDGHIKGETDLSHLMASVRSSNIRSREDLIKIWELNIRVGIKGFPDEIPNRFNILVLDLIESSFPMVTSSDYIWYLIHVPEIMYLEIEESEDENRLSYIVGEIIRKSVWDDIVSYCKQLLKDKYQSKLPYDLNFD